MDEISILKERLSQQQYKNKKLREQYNELLAILEVNEYYTNEQERKLHQQNAQINDLQNDNKKISNYIHKIENKYTEITKKYIDLLNEYNRNKSEIGKLSEANEALSRKNTEIMTKAGQLQEMYLMCKAQLHQELDALNQKYHKLKHNKELTNDMKKAEQKITDLEKANKSLTDNSQEISNMYKTLVDTLNEKEKSLINMNSQINKLQRNVEEEQKLRKSTEDFLANLTPAGDSVQLTQVKDTLVKLNNKLEQVQQEIIKEFKAASQLDYKPTSQSPDSNVTELVQILQPLSSKYDQILTKLDSSNKMSEVLLRLQDQLNHLQPGVPAGKFESLVSQFKENMGVQSKALKDLQAFLENCERKNDGIKTTTRSLKDEIGELKQQLKKIIALRGEINVTGSDKIEEIAMLEMQLDEATRECSQSKLRISELESENYHLKEGSLQSEHNIKITGKHRSIEKLNLEKRQLQDENAKLKKLIEDKEATLANQSLEAVVNDIQTDLTTMQRRLSLDCTNILQIIEDQSSVPVELQKFITKWEIIFEEERTKWDEYQKKKVPACDYTRQQSAMADDDQYHDLFQRLIGFLIDVEEQWHEVYSGDVEILKMKILEQVSGDSDESNNTTIESIYLELLAWEESCRTNLGNFTKLLIAIMSEFQSPERSQLQESTVFEIIYAVQEMKGDLVQTLQGVQDDAAQRRVPQNVNFKIKNTFLQSMSVVNDLYYKLIAKGYEHLDDTSKELLLEESGIVLDAWKKQIHCNCEEIDKICKSLEENSSRTIQDKIYLNLEKYLTIFRKEFNTALDDHRNFLRSFSNQANGLINKKIQKCIKEEILKTKETWTTTMEGTYKTLLNSIQNSIGKMEILKTESREEIIIQIQIHLESWKERFLSVFKHCFINLKAIRQEIDKVAPLEQKLQNCKKVNDKLRAHVIQLQIQLGQTHNEQVIIVNLWEELVNNLGNHLRIWQDQHRIEAKNLERLMEMRVKKSDGVANDSLYKIRETLAAELSRHLRKWQGYFDKQVADVGAEIQKIHDEEAKFRNLKKQDSLTAANKTSRSSLGPRTIFSEEELKDVEESNQTIRALKIKVVKLEHAKDHLAKKLESHQGLVDNTIKQQMLDHLHQQLAISINEHDKLSKNVKKATEAVNRDDKSTLMDEIDEQLESLRENIKRDINNLKKDIEQPITRREVTDKLLEETDQLRIKIVDLELEIENLVKQNMKMKHKFEMELNQDILAQKLQEMEGKLEKFKDNNIYITKENLALKQEHKKLTEQLNTSPTDKDTTQESCKELRVEMNALHDSNNSLKKDFIQLLISKERAIMNLETMTRREREARKLYQVWQEKYNKLRSKTIEVEEDAHDVKQKLKTCQHRMSLMADNEVPDMAPIEDKEKKDLAIKIVQLEIENTHLLKLMDQKRVKQRKGDAQCLEAELKDLKESLEKSNDANEALKMRLVKVEVENEHLIEQRENVQKPQDTSPPQSSDKRRIEELETILSQYLDLSLFEKPDASAKKNLPKLKTQELVSTNKSLQGRILNLESQLRALKEQTEVSKIKIIELEVENEYLGSEYIQTLIAKQKNLMDRHIYAKRANEMKKKLEKTEKSNGNLQAQIVSLEIANAALKKELIEQTNDADASSHSHYDKVSVLDDVPKKEEELNSVKARLAELEYENTNLTHQFQQAIEEEYKDIEEGSTVAKALVDVATLTLQNQHLRQQLEQVTAKESPIIELKINVEKSGHLGSQLTDLKKRCLDLEAKNNALMFTEADLVKKQLSVQNQNEHLMAQIVKVKQENDKLLFDHKSVEEAKMILSNESKEVVWVMGDKYEADLKALKKNLKLIDDEVIEEGIVNSLAQYMKEWKNTLKLQMNKLKKQIEPLLGDKKPIVVEPEVPLSTDDCHLLLEKLENSEVKNTELRTKLEEMEMFHQPHEIMAKISELEHQVTTYKTSKKRLELEVAELVDRKKKLEAILEKNASDPTKEELSLLKHSMEEECDKLTEVQIVNDQLADENKRLKDEIEFLHGQQNNILEGQIKNLQEEKQNLLQIIEALQKAKEERLQTVIPTEEINLHIAPITNDVIQIYSDQIKQLKARMAALEVENTDLKLENSPDSTPESTTKYHHRIADLYQTLQENKVTYDLLLVNYNKLRKDYGYLSKEKIELQSYENKEWMKQKETQLTECRHELGVLRLEKQKLLEENKTLRDDLEESRVLLQPSSNGVEDLIHNLHNEISNYRKSNQGLKNKIIELEAELDNISTFFHYPDAATPNREETYRQFLKCQADNVAIIQRNTALIKEMQALKKWKITLSELVSKKKLEESEAAVEALNQEVSELKQELVSTKHAKENEIERLRTENEVLWKESQANTELKQEFTKEITENAYLRNELEQCRSDTGKVQDLTEIRLLECQKKYDRLAVSQAKTDNENGYLKLELSKLKQVIESKDSRNFENENALLQLQNLELEREVAILKNIPSSSKPSFEETYLDLRNQFEMCRSINTKLSRKIVDLRMGRTIEDDDEGAKHNTKNPPSKTASVKSLEKTNHRIHELETLLKATQANNEKLRRQLLKLNADPGKGPENVPGTELRNKSSSRIKVFGDNKNIVQKPIEAEMTSISVHDSKKSENESSTANAQKEEENNADTEQLKNDFETLKKSQQKNNEEIENLTHKLKETEDRNTKLVTQQNATENDKLDLKEMNNKLKNELEALRKTHNETTKETDHLRQKLHDHKSTNESDIQTTDRQTQKENENFKQIMASLTQQNQQLSSELHNEVKSKNLSQQELIELKEIILQIKDNLKQNSYKNKTGQRYTERNRTTGTSPKSKDPHNERIEKSQQTEQVKEALRNISDECAKNEHLKAELSDIKEQIKQLLQEKKQIEDNNSTLTQANIELEKEVQQLKTANYKGSIGVQPRVEGDVDEQRIAQLENELRLQRPFNEELKRTIEGLKREIENLKPTLNPGRSEEERARNGPTRLQNSSRAYNTSPHRGYTENQQEAPRSGSQQLDEAMINRIFSILSTIQTSVGHSVGNVETMIEAPTREVRPPIPRRPTNHKFSVSHNGPICVCKGKKQKTRDDEINRLQKDAETLKNKLDNILQNLLRSTVTQPADATGSPRRHNSIQQNINYFESISKETPHDQSPNIRRLTVPKSSSVRPKVNYTNNTVIAMSQSSGPRRGSATTGPKREINGAGRV